MKNGKNPTRKQKEMLKERRLNPNNWLVIKSNSREFEIINRDGKRIRKYEIS